MTADTGGARASTGTPWPYVLGALDPATQRRFGPTPPACPDCLRELEELRPVADQLALAVPQVDPRRRFVGRLLQRARGPDRRPAPAGAPGRRPRSRPSR